MNKNILYLLGRIILICLTMLGCSDNTNTKDDRDLLLNDDLISAANELSHAINPQRLFHIGNSPFIEIPDIYWPSAIKSMEPIKIYYHYFNIAIVLEDKNEYEKGIYVKVSASSYIPANDEIIQYVFIKDDIYEFTKKKTVEPDPMLMADGCELAFL